MKELIKKHIEMHIKKFEYNLSEQQKFELAELYELNYEEYNEAALSLYIEQYVQRCKNDTDNDWKLHRRQSVAAQKVSPDNFDIPHYEKDAATFEFLISKLSGCLPFDMISYEQKTTLVKSMHPVQVEEGAIFIKQGDKGFHMYILQYGEFDVYINGTFTNKIYPGTMFGELALLHEIPRTATVVAAKPSTVWGAEQTSFTCIRLRDNAYKKTQVEAILRRNPPHPIFYDNPKAINQAKENVSLKFFVKGTQVSVHEGEFVLFFKETIISIDGQEVNIQKDQIIKQGFEVLADCECGIVNIKGIKL